MKTKVIFLIEDFSKNEVFAFFPYENWDDKGYKTCYACIGQHSACSIDYAKACKPASKKLFEPLLRELTSIGYDLEVLQHKVKIEDKGNLQFVSIYRVGEKMPIIGTGLSLKTSRKEILEWSNRQIINFYCEREKL